MVKSGNLKIYA